MPISRYVGLRKSLFTAPVAQLDRAFGFEPKGREFESLRAHHFTANLSQPKEELVPSAT